MTKDPWSFEENMKRGYLPTGEALEALYGTGPWTPRWVTCPRCGADAYQYPDGRFECWNCGWNGSDEGSDDDADQAG